MFARINNRDGKIHQGFGGSLVQCCYNFFAEMLRNLSNQMGALPRDERVEHRVLQHGLQVSSDPFHATTDDHSREVRSRYVTDQILQFRLIAEKCLRHVVVGHF